MPTWNASLAVGVKLLDEQHKELFERTDRLLAAMRGGQSAEEVARLLGFVDEYCARHFADEEQLMRSRGYPGFAEHLAEHAKFVKEFQRVVEIFRERGPSVTVAITIQQLVSRWLVTHIGEMDQKFATFLGVALPQASRGSAPRPTRAP